MDTFEHHENTQPAQEDGTTVYRGTGAGRKESPYANSPYVAWQPQAEQPAQPPRTEQPAAPAEQPRQDYRRTYYYEPENPAQPPKKPKSRKRKSGGKFWKRAAAVAAALALIAGSCLVTAGVVNNRWKARTDAMEAEFTRQFQELQEQIDAAAQNTSDRILIGNQVSVEGVLSPSQVYAMNVDSVVIVYSTVVYSAYGQQSTGTSTGSGFFISEDGYLLTNYHVVEGAQSVSVVTHSGEQYTARIIGSDSTNDVALLKVDATGLPAVTLGSSDDLIVGDQVAAIGNPLGELTSTMTVGYVSGKERAVTTDGTTINMIQTDAAINSGNSGGPLFNMQGEVIGITTAKYSGSSSSGASIEGIGFAIPIDDVMEVVADLMEFGYVKTAYMGVTVLDMDSSVAAMYNLPVGVYIQSVEADGPAAAAGVQPEDIITALGGTRIQNYNDLARALREYEPGDSTTITVYRGGRELELTITLAEKPQTTTSQEEQTQPESEMPSEGSYEDWFKYFEPFFGNGNNGN